MNNKDQAKATIWQHKIKAANEHFDKWKNKFNCETLEKYMEGFQWGDSPNELYTLNLFLSTFAIKRPSLLFRQPIYFVEPEPGHFNSMPEEAFNWASNATDILNTFITSDKLNYGENLEMAVVDSMAYFGMVEVGYSAKWIKNPNLKLPEVPGDYDSMDSDEPARSEPTHVPENEWIYVKRIPAHRFRVGGNDCFNIKQTDWCGYYEFYRCEDIKQKGSGFKNTSDIEYSGSRSDEFSTKYNEEDDQLEHSGELIKVWKIWDLRKKQFFIITHDTNIIIYEEPFERLPLFGLRFYKRRKGWYPVPFTFNWKSPQDEINEAREQVRSARRRAKTRYQAVENSIDEDEKDKLLTGPDGVVVTVKMDGAIKPIMHDGLDSAIGTVLQISTTDFNMAAGTSSNERGQVDRTTATETNIVNQRATIRENEEREIIATWLKGIGLEVLYQMIENFTMPIWVKTMSNLGGFFQDVQDLETSWKLLSSEDVGYIDYKINVTVESLSPVANDQEKRKFLELMAIMNQYPQLAMHPDLIREAAFRMDYKNNKVIKAFQQAAIMQMMGQMGAAQNGGMGTGQGGPQNTNVAQQTAEQMQPPDQAEIENQMNAQAVPQ